MYHAIHKQYMNKCIMQYTSSIWTNVSCNTQAVYEQMYHVIHKQYMNKCIMQYTSSIWTSVSCNTQAVYEQMYHVIRAANPGGMGDTSPPPIFDLHPPNNWISTKNSEKKLGEQKKRSSRKEIVKSSTPNIKKSPKYADHPPQCWTRICSPACNIWIYTKRCIVWATCKHVCL